MPKNIPVAVRLKGMELYVANSMSAREIAEHLTINYNISVKPPTIYAGLGNMIGILSVLKLLHKLILK